LVRNGVSRVTLPNYFIHRFSRIYIVLLPALALTFLLDVVGSHFFRIYHQAGWTNSLACVVADRDALAVFLANVANLQDAFVPAFGGTGPLRSLACEWCYYLTLPIVLAVVFDLTNRSSNVLRLCLYATGFLLLAFLLPNYMSAYPVWLCGGVASVVRSRYDFSLR
jgi:peptidoglycan/LPS O-acetylase OafA/YrhL